MLNMFPVSTFVSGDACCDAKSHLLDLAILALNGLDSPNALEWLRMAYFLTKNAVTATIASQNIIKHQSSLLGVPKQSKLCMCLSEQ